MATAVPNVNLHRITARSHGQARELKSATAAKPRCRAVSREAGRAIEMLGHAIEYLSDEFALECMETGAKGSARVHPIVAAIELMKQRNREIYMSCPEVPTFGERLRAMLRLGHA